MQILIVSRSTDALVAARIGDVVASFFWKRGHLFDRLAVLILFEMCLERPVATVTSVRKRRVTHRKASARVPSRCALA